MAAAVALALGAAGRVAASEAAAPVVAAYERFYAAATSDAARVEGGLLLLNELGCTACHAAPADWAERLPGRGKIALAGAGTRFDPAVLARFIATPHTEKPGTPMPRLGADTAEARAIVAYLTAAPAGGPTKVFPAGDARRGQRTFEQVGCVACHAPADAEAGGAAVPIALARAQRRDALAAFLQDPLRTRPGGRMPATELSDQEAADLAAYLHGGDTGALPAAPTATEAEFARGRAAFAARGCAACHAVPGAETAPARRPLAELRAGEGCLARQPADGVPDFALDARQREALTAALRAVQAGPAPAWSAEQRVTAAFEQLNCFGCHEWRGRGGVEAGRTKFFTATDSAVESLGEIGYLPPKLDQAGRKLTRAWLEKLLAGTGGGVRPAMTARMPRFGAAAAGELIPVLEEACRPVRPQEIDTSGSLSHQRFATGRTLLGTGAGGLGCVSCHGLKQREPAGVRAVNLTQTAQRLRPEYFKALLLDPQGVQPGTVMPPLLAGRAGAAKEIESMWTYFKELDQSDVLPEGLALAGSFELKPATEGRPIVFRTFLEGAGTQAVAVGFPEGVHAAFDAAEVRWALAWRGRFLDAQSNWEERAMKPIKPLGEGRRTLPTHLPLARLDAATAAWPTTYGRAAGFVFKGYRLDAAGVPTFRYTAGGLDVEDTLRPTADGNGLRRTVTVRGGGAESGRWYFRGLTTAAVPQAVEWREGAAVFEETIVLP